MEPRNERSASDAPDTDEELDGEVLRAVDLVDAETLSERSTGRDRRDPAQRAADGREWIYGHVVVDEAQEFSEWTGGASCVAGRASR